ILQSGAALGAIVTPLLILALPKEPGTWRYPFLLVGAAGATWVLLWMASVRSADLDQARPADPSSPLTLLLVLAGLFALKRAVRWTSDLPAWLPLAVSFLVSTIGVALVLGWLLRSTRGDAGPGRAVFLRRLGVLVVVVVMINGTWHFFRAWLPLFLQKQHGYGEDFMNGFLMAYYVSTDLGSLAAGSAALALARRGVPVNRSRLTVFAVCALLCTLAGVAAFLPRGPLLLGVLLVIGFAALGLFPNYYSLSQELTSRHQGKLTGALGCINWLAMALLHELVGDSIKRTGSYSLGMALAGLAPLLGFFVLITSLGDIAQK